MLRKLLCVIAVAMLTLLVGCTGLSTSNKNSSSSSSIQKTKTKSDKIVFLEYGGESSYSLQTMNSDGSGRESITTLPVTVLPSGLLFSLRSFFSLSKNGKLAYKDQHDHVHVIDLKTKSDVDITQRATQDSFSDKPKDSSPAITADGQTILFIRSKGNKRSLCIASIDGNNINELSQYSIANFTLAPDGNKIAISTSDAWNNATGQYESMSLIINQQGEKIGDFAPALTLYKELGYGPNGYHLAVEEFNWMPDSQRIIARGRSHVEIMNFDGSNPSMPVADCVSFNLPLCSPDGKTLLTTADAGASENVIIVNLGNGERRNVTNTNDRDNSSPIFIEEGNRVAFISYPKGTPAGQGDIWVTSIDGAKKTNITQSQSHYRLIGWISE